MKKKKNHLNISCPHCNNGISKAQGDEVKMRVKLVKWNNAKRAIMEAKSIDEVKAIRDKAEALRAYAKQAGESLTAQNDLCEIKLRAERRAGEMLKEREMPRATSTSRWSRQVHPRTDTASSRMVSRCPTRRRLPRVLNFPRST